MTVVRPVTPGDTAAWVQMRWDLWPGGFEGEHEQEVTRFFQAQTTEPAAVLIAEDDAGRPVGLAELSIRPCAEGCSTDRVAYLEGWYVVPDARHRGVGRALVRAAEEWGRAQGCREFASDTQPGNSVSVAAHLALGFVDVGAVRCFRKDL